MCELLPVLEAGVALYSHDAMPFISLHIIVIEIWCFVISVMFFILKNGLSQGG